MRQIKTTKTDYLFQNILYHISALCFFLEMLYRDPELASQTVSLTVKLIVRVGRSAYGCFSQRRVVIYSKFFTAVNNQRLKGRLTSPDESTAQ